MNPELFKYLCLGAYVLATLWLSWIGMRKTQSIRSFAIGNRDMNPYLIGITMAASVASTATFVINPGFVYVHGVSAFIHYALAGGGGIIAALFLLTRRFRALGDAAGAITVPDWIYQRYQSRPLSIFFALINLLSLAFVVLILVGCSLLVAELFPIGQRAALILIAAFVFSYVLMGGTYAHAYTNTLQGVMMLVISLVIFIAGWHHFGDSPMQSLRQVGEGYAGWINPDSDLYFSFFSVFGSGFLITFALMLQPHILTKMLYLKGDGDVNRFIGTTAVAIICFMLMLTVGFYARLSGLEVPQQDAVVASYIAAEFGSSTAGSYLLAFIGITLLAAGMSTLDGILVALSAMVVRDIYQPLAGNRPFAEGRGLLLSRVVLISIGVIAVVIAYDPPPLVGIFAQKGVYGLGAASLVPLLFGITLHRAPPAWAVGSAAVIGLLVHVLLITLGGITNPAVAAAYAILCSLGYFLSVLLVRKLAGLAVLSKKQKTPISTGDEFST
ncbi:sodium:solute symporter family protein [Microbulbifer hydrolyticus]|uniref:SSS family solute:Na+ symporter/sodium/pantothenate symporter n=1 Tax=Microbulbifer hydrolyticus TaxID=48074 RepID=A0A6P1TBH1_9GAMM|nr:sodium:solute symporter family protein [Microbulbifer hydrolyticus]MBB5210543.1 SSS family solute:Na+ symporter/sodium/pantothenate symporter [Microbulbifer hydrolyticus]QHQ38986.1 sodium:solute symporter family protein [Microbulbifer hydrolyticus]